MTDPAKTTTTKTITIIIITDTLLKTVAAHGAATGIPETIATAGHVRDRILDPHAAMETAPDLPHATDKTVITPGALHVTDNEDHRPRTITTKRML